MKNPEQSQRLLLVSEDDITEIKELLGQILKRIDQGTVNSAKEWLSEEDARKLVPRGRTWFFTMRLKGYITSTKIGGQPYYLKESLLRFIEKKRKDAYREQ